MYIIPGKYGFVRRKYGIVGINQASITGSGFHSIAKRQTSQIKRLTDSVSGSGFGGGIAHYKHDNQLEKMPRFIQKARNNIRFQK